MTPNELKSKYPYMFSGRAISLDFYRGWWPIFVKLCRDIDDTLGHDKCGFHWTQTKEKYGTARLYWGMRGVRPGMRLDVQNGAGEVAMYKSSPRGGGNVTAQIDALITAAEEATRSLCIYCGQPGELDTSQPWLLTVCDWHKRQRARPGNERLRSWLEDDEDAPV